MNNINALTTGTIYRLTDLILDKLTTANLNLEKINGHIIYYNKLKVIKLFLIPKFFLTNTGVLLVGKKIILHIY
jgi:hypothetical protein